MFLEQKGSFCDCITKHIYFKVFVLFVLAMMITFVDDIEFLYSKYILFVFLFVFTLVMFTNSCEIGTLVLLMILIVLISNNQANKKRQMQHTYA